MKKINGLLAVICLACSAMFVTSCGEGPSGEEQEQMYDEAYFLENLRFELMDDGSGYVAGGSGTTIDCGNVIIPEMYNDLPVVGVTGFTYQNLKKYCFTQQFNIYR